MKMRVDVVVAMVQYENFCAAYERAYVDLNKEAR